MEKKSKGHLFYTGWFEYFKAPDGAVYRSVRAITYIEQSGYRSGGRLFAENQEVAQKLLLEIQEV